MLPARYFTQHMCTAQADTGSSFTEQSNLGSVVKPWLTWIFWVGCPVVIFSALVMKKSLLGKILKMLGILLVKILKEQA